MNEPTTYAQYIERLTQPWTVGYDEPAQLRRIRSLAAFYGACRMNYQLADLSVSMARNSFWHFLTMFAWTKDEKAPLLRTKPFSPIECYHDMAVFMDERDANGQWAHRLIAIEKSRQLLLSWFCILRLYWIAHNQAHADCPIMSKNEPEGYYMIDRLKVAHGLIPDFYKGLAGLHGVTFTKNAVAFPNGSLIEAIPQKGGNAFRQRTMSAFLSDEAAHQTDFEKNWQAATGSATAGTQGMVPTTPAPSFFHRLIRDRLDGRHGGVGHTYISKQGLHIWRNKNNGLDCIAIVDAADPMRRSTEWVRESQRGVAMYQWRQEHVLDYTARGGEPIFKMLDRAVHVMAAEPEVVEMTPGQWGLMVPGYEDENHNPLCRPVWLLRAIDHGTTNFCGTLWVAVDADYDWTVFRVRKQQGWFAPENARAIAHLSRNERYRVDVIDAQQGLPDKRGHVEDIYRKIELEHDPWAKLGQIRRPLQRIEAVKKGSGSRQEGLDAIGQMLHAALSVEAPEHSYWDQEGYDESHRNSFREESCLYIGPGCEDLFSELTEARFDQRPGGDPTMNQPETSLDMMDDLIDCLRYLIRSGGRFIRSRRRDETGQRVGVRLPAQVKSGEPHMQRRPSPVMM